VWWRWRWAGLPTGLHTIHDKQTSSFCLEIEMRIMGYIAYVSGPKAGSRPAVLLSSSQLRNTCAFQG
jgi:hypothetical protein